MHQEGPDIRSLIELLTLIHRLGINILSDKYSPLPQFLTQSAQLGEWIGDTSNLCGLIGRTVTALNMACSESQKAKDKEIIVLTGNTGTGKSTAANYLLNIPMCYVREEGEGMIQVAAGYEEVAKIGHHKARSQTLFTQVHECPNTPFTIADCGGFFDTRGISSEWTVAASLQHTLASAKSVRLVFCFDSALLSSDRGIHFYEAATLVLTKLLKDYRAHPSSVLVMFTKPTRDIEGTLFNAQDAISIMTSIMDDLQDGSEQKALYQFLLREKGKYICVCNPLSVEERGAIQQILSEMMPISNTQESFQIVCQAETQVALLDAMVEVATKANELFRQHTELSAKIVQNRLKIEALNQEMSALREQKHKAEEAAQHEQLFLESNHLATVNDQLIQAESDIAQTQTTIAQMDQKLALYNTTQILTYTSTGGDWSVTGT